MVMTIASVLNAGHARATKSTVSVDKVPHRVGSTKELGKILNIPTKEDTCAHRKEELMKIPMLTCCLGLVTIPPDRLTMTVYTTR
jgi:hypothetical protein